MIMHEDFTRCDCGEAWIEKKEYILGMYVIGKSMVEQKKKVVYKCVGCGKILHTEES